MVHLFLLMVHIKTYFTYGTENTDIWCRAKRQIFGSDFLTYGAPFYKWCRFTYGAVTVVKTCLFYIYKETVLQLSIFENI
jgi:hypothetical protein